MSLAPESPSPSTRSDWLFSRTRRLLLFWLMMILLAVVLWKMASTPESKAREISYSDFQAQVEKQNVRDVVIYPRANTAAVHGTLRSTGERFRTVIPKEAIADLNSQLRKQGVQIEIGETSRADWTSLFFNMFPLVLLVVFWIYMMRRMQKRGWPR